LTAAIGAVVARVQGAQVAIPPAPAGSTLWRVQAAFGLSPFELSVVVLCAAAELSADAAKAIAAAHGDPRRVSPSFGLCVARLPGARWEAIAPGAPLRRAALVRLGEGELLTARPLHLAEPVLHALMGAAALDPAVASRVRPVVEEPALPAAQAAVAAALGRAWAEAPGAHVHLAGGHPVARDVFAAACAADGSRAWAVAASALPTGAEERAAWLAAWARDAALGGGRLLVEIGSAADAGALVDALALSPAPLVLAGHERVPEPVVQPTVIVLPAVSYADRLVAWAGALGDDAAAADLPALASTFALGSAGVRAAVGSARLMDPSLPLQRRLWRASGAVVRPRLDDLAQRVVVHASLDDIVLPSHDMASLRAIVDHLAHRPTVWHRWGFADAANRGHGTTAVFAGPSGTGKTLAAEAIAHALDLDLYRIDLSAVVSKYIGETEKNLRRIFDAAEDGGAVLLFDEADALFGKRTEVKDSHDRHANIEVSYLLQRMEAYRGLAVLTTNLRRNIDDAFLRRFQFVVDFPFPDAPLREQLWRRAFPASAPLDGVDPALLARLAVTGGHIKNIARNAAYIAASEGAPIRMYHLLAAVRQEYAKLGQPLTPGEIRGWEAR
jgi:hypothetical protein